MRTRLDYQEFWLSFASNVRTVIVFVFFLILSLFTAEIFRDFNLVASCGNENIISTIH